MSSKQDCKWCNSPEHLWRPSRREFLYVGLLGGLGLTFGDILKLQAGEEKSAGNGGAAKKDPIAKSVIQIYLPGGIAAQETFDPKVFAPIEYRGPLGTVDTVIPGVKFSQYLQETAKIADKITVVRSMTHGEAAHERGTHNMFTGYRPSPAIQYPSFGSVISHELGSRNNLPPYVCVPNQPNEFAGTGYLSSAYGPFSLGADPAQKGFTVRDLNMSKGLTTERFDRRRSILSTVDEHFRTLEKSDALTAMDGFYQAAYSLVSSPQAREAFNLAAEAERPVRAAEVAGSGKFIRLTGHADVRRQAVARTEFVADDRAERRILNRGRRTVAGEHVVRAALVRRFAVRHRADDGELVGDLRGFFEILRELHAGDRRVHGAERPAIFDRREVLRIPSFLMRAAAGEIDVDERFGGRGVLIGFICAEPEKIAHGEADAAREAGVKEFAAIHFAEMRRVFVPSDRLVGAHGMVVFEEWMN